jgi:hypothetical protein
MSRIQGPARDGFLAAGEDVGLTIGDPCDRYLILRRMRAFDHHEFAQKP